jgi:hypothetical protein
MAGPALIDPPRISTTRMIANSSTTDSEMATTDHTLRSVRSPGPGVQPHTPPPEPSCHQPGPRMPQVTHRRSGPPGSRPPPPSRGGPTARPRTVIRRCAGMGNSEGSLLCPHIPFAGISNCRHRHGEETPEGTRKMTRRRRRLDISPESPASVMHQLVVTNTDRTAPQLPHAVRGNPRIHGARNVTHGRTHT